MPDAQRFQVSIIRQRLCLAFGKFYVSFILLAFNIVVEMMRWRIWLLCGVLFEPAYPGCIVLRSNWKGKVLSCIKIQPHLHSVICQSRMIANKFRKKFLFFFLTWNIGWMSVSVLNSKLSCFSFSWPETYGSIYAKQPHVQSSYFKFKSRIFYMIWFTFKTSGGRQFSDCTKVKISQSENSMVCSAGRAATTTSWTAAKEAF